jgi:hypothetical protein
VHRTPSAPLCGRLARTDRAPIDRCRLFDRYASSSAQCTALCIASTLDSAMHLTSLAVCGRRLSLSSRSTDRLFSDMNHTLETNGSMRMGTLNLYCRDVAAMLHHFGAQPPVLPLAHGAATLAQHIAFINLFLLDQTGLVKFSAGKTSVAPGRSLNAALKRAMRRYNRRANSSETSTTSTAQ